MDDFQIGSWTYFPLSRAHDNIVKDWHDLGLTCPLTPYFSESEDKAKMLKILDQCGEHGIKVFLRDDRITMGLGKMEKLGGESAYRELFKKVVADFGAHPAVSGFYVSDEPDAPAASECFAAARIQREEAPEHLPFLNLLPWFDWIAQRIGSDAYAPYLDRAASEGCLKMLAFDCYTQMWEGDKGYDVYFNNLREHMEASQRNKIPFCPTLLCSGHYDYLCPTDDDFRWQIATAAAFGAKSIFWFYVHCAYPGENYRRFPINAFNERTSQFEYLSYENRLFLQKFGRIMPRLFAEKPMFTTKAYGGVGLFESDGSLVRAETNRGEPLLITRFSGPEANKYYAVVNLSKRNSQLFHLTFAPGVGVETVDYKGSFSTVISRTDAVGALTEKEGSISNYLAPGQMELFKIIRG